METKAEWRQRARKARSGIAVDHDAHCRELARFLASLDRAPGWVVGYLPMPGEVDLTPLMATSDLGPFALTRVPGAGDDLTVHPWPCATEEHPLGFRQPLAGAVVVPHHEVAVVLVPGLAFDRRGTRLGRGRGYYDRLLARFAPGTTLIGITGGYIVAELPSDVHDVPMTHLAGAFGVAPVPLPEPVE